MFAGGHFFVSDCANQVVAALERDIFGTLAKEPIASWAATQ
jgi:surfactin synthase thioesterase subunit